MHAAGAAEADTPGNGDGLQDSAQSKGNVPSRAGDAPRKRPLGTAWRDGSHMTIPMTTMYELNPATGQVGTSPKSLLSWHLHALMRSPGGCVDESIPDANKNPSRLA